MAEYYGLTEQETQQLIDIGRAVHERIITYRDREKDILSNQLTMELITLTAKKKVVILSFGNNENIKLIRTFFYKPDGSFFASTDPLSRQPRKDKRTIVLNCFTYKLNWI